MDIPSIENISEQPEITPINFKNNENNPNSHPCRLLLALLEISQQVKKATKAACKALPPWAEKLRIEKAIHQNEEIKKALESDIVSIEKDGDIYIVKGENKELHIRVNYEVTELIGPPPFSLEILNS